MRKEGKRRATVSLPSGLHRCEGAPCSQNVQRAETDAVSGVSSERNFASFWETRGRGRVVAQVSYWRQVFGRAWELSKPSLGLNQKALVTYGVPILIALISGVLTFDSISSAGVGVVSFLIVGVIIFCMNVMAAISEMHHQQEQELAAARSAREVRRQAPADEEKLDVDMYRHTQRMSLAMAAHL